MPHKYRPSRIDEFFPHAKSTIHISINPRQQSNSCRQTKARITHHPSSALSAASYMLLSRIDRILSLPRKGTTCLVMNHWWPGGISLIERKARIPCFLFCPSNMKHKTFCVHKQVFTCPRTALSLRDTHRFTHPYLMAPRCYKHEHKPTE